MTNQPARPLTTASILSLVQRVAERLVDSRELSGVFTEVRRGFEESLGSAALMVGVINETGTLLEVVSVYGMAPTTEELLRRPLPVEGLQPAAGIIAGGTPIFWSSLAQRDEQFPEWSNFPSDNESWAVLPLTVRGRAIGILAVGWRDERPFSGSDIALMELMAHQCAIAVDRMRLEQEVRRERETLELLSEGTRLMVSALDPDQILRRLVRLAVPRLAPWCAVYVEEGDHLRQEAFQAAGRPRAPTRDHLPEVRVDADVPLAAVFRTGLTKMVLAPHVGGLRDVSIEPEQPAPLAHEDSWIGIVVPVNAAGRTIGVMSLVSDEWAGTPMAQLRFPAEGLAGRAGLALEHARRFERERLTAAMLTQALIPAEIPRIPGFETAARYLPAGSKVAGDWFDFARLSADEFLVGVGDAAGHGIQAASLMAQLRNAARGLAVVGNSPSKILDGLRSLAVAGDPDNYATAIYATLNPAEGSLRWASAGHIPPISFSPSGASILVGTKTPPLGLPFIDSLHDTVLQFAPNDGIVLLTDGVIEQRGEDLGSRLEILRSLAAEHATAPVEEIAERIVERLCEDPEDDCCLVVLRRIGS